MIPAPAHGRTTRTETGMSIQIGDRIPEATLNFIQDGVQAVNTG